MQTLILKVSGLSRWISEELNFINNMKLKKINFKYPANSLSFEQDFKELYDS